MPRNEQGVTSGALGEQPGHGARGVQDLPTRPPEKLWGEESENAPMGLPSGRFCWSCFNRGKGAHCTPPKFQASKGP